MQIAEIKAGEVKSVRRMFVGLLESEQEPSGESRLSQLENWPPPPAGFKNKIEEVSVNSLGELKEKDPAAYALFLLHGRSTARTAGDRLKMIGDLFLRMLKMVSVPLIIFYLFLLRNSFSTGQVIPFRTYMQRGFSVTGYFWGAINTRWPLESLIRRAGHQAARLAPPD